MHPYDLAPHLKEVVERTGYASIRSLEFFHELVKRIDPETVLELGTGLGCSSIFMALAFDGKVVSLDDYREGMSPDMDAPKDNARKCGVHERITYVCADTRSFRCSGVNPEVVFMDASHNRKDMEDEYGTFFPTLRKDHVVIIDDYFSTDVRAFVADKVSAYEATVVFTDLHQGVAVMMTSVDRYLSKVVSAYAGTGR